MRPTREYTKKLLDAIEAGLLDKDTVILACLGYMSERDVKQMCDANLFFEHEEEEDKDYTVWEIKWDTDEDDARMVANGDLVLPETMVVTVPAGEDPEDFISDAITEQVGFCHKGFQFEEEEWTPYNADFNDKGSIHHY